MWVISIGIVILSISAFLYVFGPIDHIPRIRAVSKSPDGALVVRVYKKRLSLLPTVRTGILVRILDARQDVLYERIIFEDSWWHHDFEDMYTQIVFEGDEIRIGPKFTPNDYFVIKRTELRVGNP